MKNPRFVRLSVLVFIAATCVYGSTVSNFDTGDEGWLSVSFTLTNPPGPILNVYPADWLPSGGNPGGFITTVDPDGDAPVDAAEYWNAPAKFLGNQSGNYGGSLSFDLMDSIDIYNPLAAPDLVLIGGGETLVHALPYPVPNTEVWSHYSIPLSPSGWQVYFASGAPATAADMRTVWAP